MSTQEQQTHTPGPWIVESWRSNFTEVLLIQQAPHDGPRKRRIASIPWRDEGLEIQGKALEQATAFNAIALANARLIAAAPELLTALCDLATAVKESCTTGDALKTAAIAIAKATK